MDVLLCLVVVLVISLPCGIVAGTAYQKKGRDMWLGFIVGVLLGPLGLLLALMSSPDWNTVKRCPHCRALNGMHRTACGECRKGIE